MKEPKQITKEKINGLKDHQIRELTTNIEKYLEERLFNVRLKIKPGSYISHGHMSDSAIILIPDCLREIIAAPVRKYLTINNLKLDK